MKKLKQTVMLIGVTALMMAVNSCKKEPDVNDIAQTSINDENDAEGRCHHHHQCLAIHTEDDGLGYVQDIYYNGHQNPDSLVEGNVTLIATYDYYGRLSKKKYRFYDWQDYEKYYYQGNSSLPNVIKYIVPNFTDYGMTDSLNAIDSLWYNCKGEMIKFKETNYWYTDSLNNFIDLYAYNNHGNVTGITRTYLNATPFPFLTASLYDNKDNFLSGNKWVKYLEMHIYYEPYYFLLYSRNNMSSWVWTFDPTYAPDVVTSTFTYNQYSFATQIALHVFDGTSYYDFTRTNVSTCDNNGHHRETSHGGASNGFPLFKNNLSKLNNQQQFLHPITNNHFIRN